MADEAPDEIRERIRADLRRAGLLPPLTPPRDAPGDRRRYPQRSVAAFLIGFLLPALAILAFWLVLTQIGGR